MEHLQKKRGWEIQQVGDGIYYVIGDEIPIQILVTKELPAKENLWLRSLTDQLEDAESARELLVDYEKNRNSNLYKSIMEIVIRANEEKFKEAKGMCEALRELMKEEFDEERMKGKEIGKEIGVSQINELNQKLAQAGRMDDIIKAARDKVYQDSLLKEFGL